MELIYDELILSILKQNYQKYLLKLINKKINNNKNKMKLNNNSNSLNMRAVIVEGDQNQN